MRLYKIKHKSGKYSKGGVHPTFGKQGKFWVSRGALSNHLTLVMSYKRNKDVYADCEIIEYYLEDDSANFILIPEYIEAMNIRRHKREFPKYVHEYKESLARKELEIEAAKQVLRQHGISI